MNDVPFHALKILLNNCLFDLIDIHMCNCCLTVLCVQLYMLVELLQYTSKVKLLTCTCAYVEKISTHLRTIPYQA
jgi:hypothetical protein